MYFGTMNLIHTADENVANEEKSGEAKAEDDMSRSSSQDSDGFTDVAKEIQLENVGAQSVKDASGEDTELRQRLTASTAAESYQWVQARE